MTAGSWELARVPNVMFEAFREERPAPLAVTFETLMMAGSRPLATVPKARFEAFRFEIVFPPPMKKGAVTFPDALRPVRVPRDVTLVWAVASCAAATTPNVRFEAFMEEMPAPLAVTFDAETTPKLDVVETFRVVHVMKGTVKVL